MKKPNLENMIIKIKRRYWWMFKNAENMITQTGTKRKSQTYLEHGSLLRITYNFHVEQGCLTFHAKQLIYKETNERPHFLRAPKILGLAGPDCGVHPSKASAWGSKTSQSSPITWPCMISKSTFWCPFLGNLTNSQNEFALLVLRLKTTEKGKD